MLVHCTTSGWNTLHPGPWHVSCANDTLSPLIDLYLWRGLTDRIRPSSGGILVRVESERLDRAQSDFLGSRCVSFHQFLDCSCSVWSGF